MAKTDREINSGSSAMIDQNLKKVYDDLAGEEIPDRFKDLLAKLKQQDSGAGDSK